jgi:hypothetical protein
MFLIHVYDATFAFESSLDERLPLAAATADFIWLSLAASAAAAFIPVTV